MKVLIGAAAAMMLFAAAAQAQEAPAQPAAPVAPPAPSRCGAAPEAPELPDGATANRQRWDAGLRAHNAWVEAVNVNLTCRAEEARELQAALQARVAEHTEIRTTANTRSEAIMAEQEEYSERQGRR